jgi:hypothetical protein
VDSKNSYHTIKQNKPSTQTRSGTPSNPVALITLLSDSVAKCHSAQSLQTAGCDWLLRCCSEGRSLIYWQVTHRAAGSDVITPSPFCKLTTLFTFPSFYLSTDISLKKGNNAYLYTALLYNAIFHVSSTPKFNILQAQKNNISTSKNARVFGRIF